MYQCFTTSWMKNADLQRAADHCRDAADNLTKKRLNFQAVKDEAARMYMTYEATPIFAEKRIANRKSHFKEFVGDSRLSNPVAFSRVNKYTL